MTQDIKIKPLSQANLTYFHSDLKIKPFLQVSQNMWSGTRVIILTTTQITQNIKQSFRKKSEDWLLPLSNRN